MKKKNKNKNKKPHRLLEGDGATGSLGTSENGDSGKVRHFCNV